MWKHNSLEDMIYLKTWVTWGHDLLEDMTYVKTQLTWGHDLLDDMTHSKTYFIKKRYFWKTALGQRHDSFKDMTDLRALSRRHGFHDVTYLKAAGLQWLNPLMTASLTMSGPSHLRRGTRVLKRSRPVIPLLDKCRASARSGTMPSTVA